MPGTHEIGLECGVCCGKMCALGYVLLRSVLNSDDLAQTGSCRRSMSMLGIGQIQSAMFTF